MDAHAFIEFMNQPLRKRLEDQSAFLAQEAERGLMMGRMGSAPVGPLMDYRDLTGHGFHEVLVFGSNSYLNLGTHPKVVEKVVEATRAFGIGTGGSPAFSGYTRQHRDLELRLAALAGHEDALLLPGGYMANLAWVNGLLTRNDVLLYDKHSHASVINAIKMTGVTFFPYDPDDLPGLRRLIGEIRSRRGEDVQLVATVEGVRSIDGSVIDLHQFMALCEAERIFVVLDDAHGLGVLGATGKGTLEHLGLMGRPDMRMSTCSKALGAQGAFVSGSRDAIQYLRTFAKPYTFTTALAQPTVAAIQAALDVLEEEPWRLEKLHANRRYLEDALEGAGFRIQRTCTGIVPMFLPDGIAGNFNRALHRKGLFVNVMEYPMVPPGGERLRFSLMADHTPAQMDRAVALVADTAQEFGVA